MRFRKLISPSRIAGVEVVLTGTGMEIFFTVLKKEKSSVITELSKESITSMEQLQSVLPQETAVYLTVNGKGILHKKISSEQNANDNNSLQAILPNANIADFYFQKYQTVSDDDAFLAVIRKNTLDELLNQFKKNHINVVECFFGPFAINSIIGLLNRDELNFKNHRLHFSDNSISNYQSLDVADPIGTITIGNETIKASLLLSFATAFSYFLSNQSRISNNIKSIVTDKEEFNQKNLFEFSKWAMAIFFFILFLSNFFVFNHFFEKKNTLAAQLSVHQENFNRYESLKKELQEKESLIDQLGISKNSRISYYADQLALDMPASILLSRLNIHPAIKKNNPNEESFFEFSPKLIIVEGSCSKSIELNDWIKTIQKKKWVKEVAMSNYNQNKETGRGDFILEVKAHL